MNLGSIFSLFPLLQKNKKAQFALEYNNSQRLRKDIYCRHLCQVSVTRVTYNNQLPLQPRGAITARALLC